MTILPALTPDDWATATSLVREYAASLGVDLEFQHFADEIANLAREYGTPAGTFLMAYDTGTAIGCGGLRPSSDDACEMKRLYVRPVAQGRGIGRTLAIALIAEARRLGYRRMLLDTLPSMRQAHALYHSLGFIETAPYRFNPVEGTTFLELNLR